MIGLHSTLKGAINPALRSAVRASIAQPFAQYKLYEGSGTTVSDSSGAFATLDVAGTLANIWTESGWLSFSGDNYAYSRDSEFDSLLDLVNSSALLIALDYQISANPTATENLLTYGASFNSGADSGGITIRQISTGHINVVYWPTGLTAGSTSIYTSAGLAAGRSHVAVLVDRENLSMSLFLNGVLQASDAIASGGILTANPGVFGFVIGGRDAGTGTFSAQGILGSSTARSVRMGNIVLKNFAQSPVDDIESIVAGLYSNPGDLPRALGNY